MDKETGNRTLVVIDAVPPWKGLTELLREKGYSPDKPNSIAEGLDRCQKVHRAAREHVASRINPFDVQPGTTGSS